MESALPLGGGARRKARAAAAAAIQPMGDFVPSDPSRMAKSATADVMITCTFTLAIIVLMFHTWEGALGPIAQGIGIGLVLLAGAVSWTYGHRPAPPTPVEICVALMVPLSLLRLTMAQDLHEDTIELSFLFSILLLLMIGSNASLTRRFDLKGLIELSATAIAISAFICLAVDYDGIVAGTTAGHGEKWELRLRPLGLHHNLGGIIFSLGILLSIYRVIAGNIWAKLFFLTAILLEAAIVIATGARGGLLACVASLLLVMVLRVTNLPKIVRVSLVLAMAASPLALPYFDTLASYFNNVFELDTKTRGFDSGATGRTAVWAEGVAYIFRDPMNLLFGAGLRTASPDEIGFSTENSYVTVTIESGAILAMSFFAILFATVVRLYYCLTIDRRDEVLISFGVIAVIQFAMIESFFNRYLLAIGNPASVIFMIAFVGGWLHANRILGNPLRRPAQQEGPPAIAAVAEEVLTPKQRRQARSRSVVVEGLPHPG